ncbi:MAG: TatD family hydrolase [Candidatus Omnitrophota bacterium]|nr:TatD family hydrolase [Candidatus Omnitrophota bacterium]
MAVFVDTHVHLHFPDYREDREEVIERARAEGIAYFINIGTNLATSREALEIAHAYEDVYASAGIHPHDAKDAGAADIAQLEELLKDDKMVAIGEVGLDFFRNISTPEVQIAFLERFLELQQRVKKPLVIHCRDAYDKLDEVLASAGGKPYEGVMHCYSSDREVMKRFLDYGFYISFAGPLTYKKNDALREACRACPIDRLLIETDAPYLPPQSKRGKRNESAYMLETAELMAALHGVRLEALGERITQNAKELFSL